MTFLSGDVEMIFTVSGSPVAGLGTVTDAPQKVPVGRTGAVVVAVVAVDVGADVVDVTAVDVTAGWVVVVVVPRARVLDVVVAPLRGVVVVVVLDPGDNVELLELKTVVDGEVVVVLPLDTGVVPPEPMVAATAASAATATARTPPVIRADSGHALSAAISRDMRYYLPNFGATQHGRVETLVATQAVFRRQDGHSCLPSIGRGSRTRDAAPSPQGQ